MKHIKKFNEITNYNNVSKKLYFSHENKSDWYNYLGESNSNEWKNNIKHLFYTYEYEPLSPDDIDKIKNALGSDFKSHIMYPTLRQSTNSRFGCCWFSKKLIDNWGRESGFDMCIQRYSHEWYLVSINDQSSRNYWFKCDTIEGVINLINDKFNI